MVSSLDVIIAKRDNSISWFETSDYYEKGTSVSETDKEEFLKAIDCYIMGARTYEHALALSKDYGWAYGDKPTIVLTCRNLPVDRPNVEIYSGSLEKLITDRLKPAYQHVWLAGGAMLSQDFIRLKLADEIRLSILPVILGDGLRFFDNIIQEQALHLANVNAYKNGMVELIYKIVR